MQLLIIVSFRGVMGPECPVEQDVLKAGVPVLTLLQEVFDKNYVIFALFCRRMPKFDLAFSNRIFSNLCLKSAF